MQNEPTMTKITFLLINVMKTKMDCTLKNIRVCRGVLHFQWKKAGGGGGILVRHTHTFSSFKIGDDDF